MDTVEALKNTSKGKLRYSTPWEKRSPSEKKIFLEELSYNPPISTEAASHRIRKLNTTQNFVTASPSPPLSPVLTPPITPPVTPTNITYTLDSKVLSPIDEIREDLNEYLTENEDHIMKDVETNMARWRAHFESLEHHKKRPVVSAATDRKREELKRIEAQEEIEEENALKKLIEDKLKNSENSYLSHYQSLKNEIQRNEKRRQLQMQELQEARKERARALALQFELCSKHVTNIASEGSTFIKSCQFPGFINKEALMTHTNVLNAVLLNVTTLSNQQRSSEAPSEEVLHKVQSLVAHGKHFLNLVKEELAKANALGKQALEKQAELERRKKEMEEKERKSQQPVKVDIPSGSGKKESEKTGGEKSTGQSASLEVTVSSNALTSYSAYQEKIEEAIKNTNGLSKSPDARVKKYRFELQKAVNTPVCGISDQSGDHLIDKIKRLKQILSGGSVNVVGGTVSTREHPEAKLYCLNFLAKKLVKQGEEQVSSRPDTAFPIAGVIAHLSCEFPELMQLFVAHSMSMCPMLVPMYFEKSQSTNKLEWHKLQGYRVSEEGAIEKEDMFLKRIGGMVKLYAAVMQTGIAAGKPHPYGLEHGWVLLARLLNTAPKGNITATVVYIILEVCGNGMLKKYGRQFQKLIRLLYREYLPKLAEVTPSDHQGPYSRLKMFLDDCLTKGRIPEPEGALSANFWTTHTRGSTVVGS